MLPDDALEALGLEAGAAATEIKEAYRDLVKVWHPDRFGNDVRLRRKAEEKLQQINDAYRVLQSHPGPVGVYSSSAKAAKAYRSSDMRSAKGGRHDVMGLKRITVGWTVAGCCAAIVVLVVVMALHFRSKTVAEPQVIPETQSQEPMSKGNSGTDASPRTELHVSPGKTNPPHRAVTPSFRVRQLTDAEAERVESVCQREKEQQDPAKYQECVSAQLGNAAPDMSSLSAEDRSGIQSACKKTKSRDGTAAYNRCLMRMMKLLVETPRP
ncbi:MAG: J domain-containing protein [Acidobacteria bacterium]|nr:J domain-containing protein [Acidobacteriota bacterium]